MCGIAGGTQCDEAVLAEMLSAIRHRGPDGSGVFVDREVGLGHVRLAVVDLTPLGRQPMWYRHAGRSACITFNGEVYNFQELRRELEGMGFTFASRSDTEVVLAAYLAWDTACVHRFNGMWAFAIYDPDRRLLFCSRDRFGKKPFFYHSWAGGLRFGSELKAMLASPETARGISLELDPEAVQLYFALGFIPSPWTIYRGIRKLQPGHNLVFDLSSNTMRMARYYEPPPYAPEYKRTSLLEEGRALLQDAIRLRLIADVPVGAFLSGGLDSSSIVGAMTNLVSLPSLHTFSMGFHGPYDESAYIELVRRRCGTQHHHAWFSKSDFDSLLSLYPRLYDEPFGDFSGFPTYALSRVARQNVTVCLSGDGGDEMFGGYSNHLVGRRFDLLRRLPPALRSLGAHMPIRQNPRGSNRFSLVRSACALTLGDPAEFYVRARRDDGVRPEVFGRWITTTMRTCLDSCSSIMAESMRVHDLLFLTLPDLYLTKVDRASMREALEIRSPFLDHRLAEYSARIPAEWKVGAVQTKKFMRELVQDLVPSEILRRGKQGFTPPLADWIDLPEYRPVILRGLKHLIELDPTIGSFYRDTAMAPNTPSYSHYRIRLFLYGLWLENSRPHA